MAKILNRKNEDDKFHPAFVWLKFYKTENCHKECVDVQQMIVSSEMCSFESIVHKIIFNTLVSETILNSKMTITMFVKSLKHCVGNKLLKYYKFGGV